MTVKPPLIQGGQGRTPEEIAEGGWSLFCLVLICLAAWWVVLGMPWL